MNYLHHRQITLSSRCHRVVSFHMRDFNWSHKRHSLYFRYLSASLFFKSWSNTLILRSVWRKFKSLVIQDHDTTSRRLKSKSLLKFYYTWVSVSCLASRIIEIFIQSMSFISWSSIAWVAIDESKSSDFWKFSTQ